MVIDHTASGKVHEWARLMKKMKTGNLLQSTGSLYIKPSFMLPSRQIFRYYFIFKHRRCVTI